MILNLIFAIDLSFPPPIICIHLIIIHSSIFFCPSPILLSMHPSVHLLISLIPHPSTHLSIPHFIAPDLPSPSIIPTNHFYLTLVSLSQRLLQHLHLLISPYFLHPLSSESKQCFGVFFSNTWEVSNRSNTDSLI